MDAITVDAHGIVALANSIGTDPDLDYLPLIGTWTFTPTLLGPTTRISTQDIVALAPVNCAMDTNGNLRPPADGQNPPIDSNGNLMLVCPQSTDLLDQGWTWTATFTPDPSLPTINGFTILKITGTPGQTINLTTVFPTTPTVATTQIVVYEVNGFNPASPVLPTGFRDGIDWILDTSTMTLYAD
jgi:hypothetical protein